MPTLLLPVRAGRARRNRRAEALGAVIALRQTMTISRDQLIDEIDWLAWRARISGNRTVYLMLMFIIAAMRRYQAHEMLDVMIDADHRAEGGAR
jgi:hypothetical protein